MYHKGERAIRLNLSRIHYNIQRSNYCFDNYLVSYIVLISNQPSAVTLKCVHTYALRSRCKVKGKGNIAKKTTISDKRSIRNIVCVNKNFYKTFNNTFIR